MAKQRVGILHPGDMGVSVALSAIDSGCEVYWVSVGRRGQTRARASEAGLLDAGSIAGLCELCPVIVSVCPPEFAWNVAREVRESGFQGVFADINALDPREKAAMGKELEGAGIAFVDGGIIGLPSRTAGETTVFLSGPKASDVSECLRDGAIRGFVLGSEVGRASALKILFAGYNKGLIALYSALFAAAEEYGVLNELRGQFVHRGLSLEKIDLQISRAAPKAWRWVPEMHQISAALEHVGMPPEFHAAAAKVYEKLAGMKDREKVPVQDVINALRPQR